MTTAADYRAEAVELARDAFRAGYDGGYMLGRSHGRAQAHRVAFGVLVPLGILAGVIIQRLCSLVAP